MSGYTGGIGGLPSRPPAHCFNYVIPIQPPDPDPDPDACPDPLTDEQVGMYWSGIDELTIDFTDDVTNEELEELFDSIDSALIVFRETNSNSTEKKIIPLPLAQVTLDLNNRKIIVTNVQSLDTWENPSDVVMIAFACNVNNGVIINTTRDPESLQNPSADASLWLPDDFWESSNPPFDVSGSRKEWRLGGGCEPSSARYYCDSDAMMITSSTVFLQNAAYVNISSDLGQFDNIQVTPASIGAYPWEQSVVWFENFSQYGFDFYVINVFDANDNLLCSWNPPYSIWKGAPWSLDSNDCMSHGLFPSAAGEWIGIGQLPPSASIEITSVESSWGDNNDVSIFDDSCYAANNDPDSDPRLWMQLNGQGFDSPGITHIRVLDENNNYVDYPYSYGSGQADIKFESSTQLFLNLGRYDEIPWHPGNIVHVSFIENNVTPIGYAQALIQMESVAKMGMDIYGGFRINFTAPWQHDIRKVKLSLCLGFAPGDTLDTDVEVRNPLTPADISWNTNAGFSNVIFNSAGAISFDSGIHSMNLVARVDILDEFNQILSSITRRRFEAM